METSSCNIQYSNSKESGLHDGDLVNDNYKKQSGLYYEINQ